ncbi:MAG TPA: ribosomal protein S18-alanine N-acetyltransferase [Pyrinomonadaceae bacterium]|nr:ribosomal protein S18-alanine N-acetyltransferase [Pyrinomonadaceae bacterium]
MATTQPTVEQIKREFLISRMTEHDLLEVVEIEEQSGLSRWGWSAYYAELHGPNREFMLVARPRQKQDLSISILGYIVARFVAGEIHINNVAVRQEFRRQGLGSILLNQIVQTARVDGGIVAFLEVRAGNLAAQALYERCGFRQVARRPNYYSAPVEDALVMSLKL